MGKISVGENIAKLRRQKGITQEALAEIAGVTAQAVSKWEGGGSPDIELLPVIADYFRVSIDSLFGREFTDCADIQAEMAKSIIAIKDRGGRLRKVFDYCWTLELAIYGRIPGDSEKTADMVAEKCAYARNYSQMILDNGFTSVGINEPLRYFLIMPEPPGGWKVKLHFKNRYAGLFRLLSDADTLKAVFLFNSRQNKPFTPKLLENELGISAEKAAEILVNLTNNNMVLVSEVELDDTVQTVYNFTENIAIIPFLTFAEELIDKPHTFYCNIYENAGPYLS